MQRYLAELQLAATRLQVLDIKTFDVFLVPTAEERVVFRSAEMIIGVRGQRGTIAAAADKIGRLVLKLDRQRAKPLTAEERTAIRAALYPKMWGLQKEILRNFKDGKYDAKLFKDMMEMAIDLKE